MSEKRQQDTPPGKKAHGTSEPQPQQGSANPAAAQPGAGTEPRSGERLGRPSSQGLAGAQGSGGGAERGVQQPPGRARPAANRDENTPSAPPASGSDATSGGDAGR